MYESVIIIFEYVQWFLLLAGIVMTVKIVHILMANMGNIDNFATVWLKIKNILIASVIAFTLSGVITLISGYYR